MRVRMKQYVGRLIRGAPLVYVIKVDGDSRFLRCHTELCNYEHLHEWGRGGPGSLQLAYDILYDATGDDIIANKLHRIFQQKYIVPLARRRPWKMSEPTVLKAAVLLGASGGTT